MHLNPLSPSGNGSAQSGFLSIGASRRRSLFSLSYTSRCLIPPDQQRNELSRILSISARSNSLAYVSGALTLQVGAFLHVLEGAEDDVMGILKRIERDPRHEAMKVLTTRKGGTRRFAAHACGLAGRSTEAQVYFASCNLDPTGLDDENLARLMRRLIDIDHKYLTS